MNSLELIEIHKCALLYARIYFDSNVSHICLNQDGSLYCISSDMSNSVHITLDDLYGTDEEITEMATARRTKNIDTIRQSKINKQQQSLF